MKRTDTTFAELGVAEPVIARLDSRGITHPFDIQALVLPDALAGRDILGKAKTGAGKTLAFAIPIAQRVEPGTAGTRALVLVPTRELCSQVADEIVDVSPSDLRVLAVYGGSSLGRDIREASKADVIVATPGRLIDLIERRAADLSKVGILVIDEADRMADMGFLPQVAKILKHVPERKQTMLFSATLDRAVHGLIAQTRDPVRHEVAEQQITVETVEHHLFKVHPMDKVAVLTAILKSSDGLSLVFTRTKRGCDKLANDLRDEGLKAVAIHGDLAQQSREDALDRFERGKVDVLVATDVAARGLDISNVRRVINYDPPQDFKAYLHRVGRTARAGLSGVGITLATWEQLEEVDRMARQLRLRPNIVEIYSTDERLGQLGTGTVEGAHPLEEEEYLEVVGGSSVADRLRRGPRRRRRR